MHKTSKVVVFTTLLLISIWLLSVIVSNAGAYANMQSSDEEHEIWDGNFGDSFHGGSGTQSDPYLISNGAELSYLEYLLETTLGSETDGKYFELTNDIYLNDTTNWMEWENGTAPANSWYPIGSNKRFKGYFNGNNHAIHGLYIAFRNYDSYPFAQSGLFGYTIDAVIENLGIVESLILSTNGGYAGGGIVAYARDSAVRNCYATGTFTGENCGSIVGCSENTTVSQCYSSGEVSATHSSGAIVGRQSGGIVENCYNSGVVYAGWDTHGGIVGESVSNGIIRNCYNIGCIIGGDLANAIGGIVGSNVAVENCYYVDTCHPNLTNNCGTMLTEAQFRNASNYVGFDFSSVWTMAGNPDYPYAELMGVPHEYTSLPLPTPIPQNTPTPEPGIPGDIDGNGGATIADAVTTLRIAMQLIDGSGLNTGNADMDGNGSLTIADAVVILRIAMGLV